jgi:hypothetical protein
MGKEHTIAVAPSPFFLYLLFSSCAISNRIRLYSSISFDEAFLTFTLPQSGQRSTSSLAMKVNRQASQVKKLSAKSSNLMNLYSVKASLMKDNN